MALLHDLFSTDVGLFAVAVIGGVLVIGAVIGAILRKKMNETPSS